MIVNIQFVCGICDMMIDKYANISQEIANKLSSTSGTQQEEDEKKNNVMQQIVAQMMN